MASVSIVIPAKNESDGIRPLLVKLKETVPDAEIVVVDDGSTDDTRQVALDAGAVVVSHPYSMGNGAAIKSGARKASNDILICMDADGQHDPKYIPGLLKKLDEGFDMVVGARDAGSQASAARGFANYLYNRLASYMVGHPVPDLTSGYRAVRRAKFIEFLSMLPNGFSYPTTITMAFFRAGYSVAYHTIHADKRIGKSHINLLQDGVRFFLIIFKIGTLYSPLKIFFPIAIASFTLASMWYCYTFVNLHRFTNMSALLYVNSNLVFLMGLVSEQITSLVYQKNSTKE